MKPDEDYEDVEDGNQAGNSRAMSWMVLAIAVGGFSALAYYAYHSGTRDASENGVVVIEADGTPIKQAPVDAQGEQFANKDKTIYDVIAPDGSKQVEKLMPEPERPVAAADMEDEDSIAAAQEPVATLVVPAPMIKAPEVKTVPTKEATLEAKIETPVKTEASVLATTTYVAEAQAKRVQAAEVVAAAPVAKPQEASYAAPKMINEKSVTGKVEKPKAAKPQPKEKIGTPPIAPVETSEAPSDASASSETHAEKPAEAVSTGAYRIQLGAYSSEAEAQGAWNKISGKFSSVLSGGPSVVKAEVKGKTYYRLRTGSFASSAAAKAACGKLGGQACMAVK